MDYKMNNKVNEQSGLIAILAMVVVVLITMLVLFTTWKANKDRIMADESDTDEIVAMVRDKFYETYLYLASVNAYCNDTKHQSSTDKLDEDYGYNAFYASTQFKSYDEMIDFLKTIMSEEIINKNNLISKDLYREENDKLYCADLGKGGVYNYGVYSVTVNNASDNEIHAEATMELAPLSNDESLYEDYDLVLQLIEDNWVITSYVRK